MTNLSPQHGLTCWLLDTRPLWPGTKIAEAAPEALSLLSPEERKICLGKYHIADAKMSLASALLKRLFAHKALGIPWSDVKFGRKRDPKHGKPCIMIPSTSSSVPDLPAPVEFNVSHQAGLVALVGCRTDELDADLGVDIVCVNERASAMQTIEADGWEAWVDIYADLFSHEEVFDMKYNCDPFPLNDGTIITPELLGRHDRICVRHKPLTITLENGEKKTFDSDLIIDAKLRRFYTYWCHKEAYIKLDGEALLATWIPELEFKNVRAPCPGTPARCSTHGTWGERVTDTKVYFKRQRLMSTRIEICAFEENYMIGVAAKDRGWLEGVGNEGMLPEVLTNFVGLDLEADILDVARKG